MGLRRQELVNQAQSNSAKHAAFRLALRCGKERFCMGEIPTTTKDPSLLNPFVVDKDRYTLDLASNSRSDGRFTFNLRPIGKDYYGTKTTEQWLGG